MYMRILERSSGLHISAARGESAGCLSSVWPHLTKPSTQLRK